MKQLLFFFLFFTSTSILAQNDSSKVVEPGMETSFDNDELLIISLVGLVILLVLYFYFKRSRGIRK